MASTWKRVIRIGQKKTRVREPQSADASPAQVTPSVPATTSDTASSNVVAANHFRDGVSTDLQEDPVVDGAHITSSATRRSSEDASIGGRVSQSPPLPDEKSIESIKKAGSSSSLSPLKVWTAALWDAAYESLKGDAPELWLLVTEPLLHNDIAQADPSARRAQTSSLIDLWFDVAAQRRSEDDDTSDEQDEALKGDNDVPEGAFSGNFHAKQGHSLKRALIAAARSSPYASLIWVASCLAVQTRSFELRSLTEVISVTSRIQWYICLSRICHDDDREVESSNRSKEALVELYKSILSYEMLVVCELRKIPKEPSQPSLVDVYTEIKQMEEAFRNSFDQGLQDRLTKLFKTIEDEQVELLAKPATQNEEHDLQALLSKLFYSPSSLCTDDKQRTMPSQANDQLKNWSQTGNGRPLDLIYEWAQSTAQYKTFFDWSSAGGCRVLWVHGELGSGKSLLLHASVRRALLHDGARDLGSPKVAYFLGGNGIFNQEDALSVLKTLISHILNNSPSLSRHLKLRFDDTEREYFDGPTDFYAVSMVFYSLIQDPEFPRTCFVVDSMELFATGKRLSTGKLLKTLGGVNEVVRAAAGESMRHLDQEYFYLEDIAIAPAGDRLAAAVGSGTESAVALWESPNFDKFSLLFEDEKAGEAMQCVRFSPSGDLLASSFNSFITVWNLKTRRPLLRIPGRRLQAHEVSRGESAGQYEVPPDGVRDGQMPDGIPVKTECEDNALEHAGRIDGLDFSPDSRFLASGSNDRIARIWDFGTGKMVAVLKYHSHYVDAVSFSSDGTRLATGSSDTTIAVWRQRSPGFWGNGDVRTQPDQVLSGHTGAIWSVSFAPHGSVIASSSRDEQLRLWDTDADTGADKEVTRSGEFDQLMTKSAANNPGHQGSYLSCVALSPKGEVIASASADGVICLWDGKTGARRHTSHAGHKAYIQSLAFSQDSRHLVSASTDYTALVWDVGSADRMVLKYRLNGHDNWLRDAVFSPDGGYVATASDDCDVRLWNISAASKTSNNNEKEADEDTFDDVPVSIFRGHQDYVYSVAFSPDGKRLASGGDDFSIMIWNLPGEGETQDDKSKPDIEMSGGERMREYIRGVVFSPDGSRVISTCNDGTITIWNAEKSGVGQCRTVTLDTGRFSSMRFDSSYPNILLTEYGAWKFDISEAEGDTPEPLRLFRPVAFPFGIDRRGGRITWNERTLIELPYQFRPVGNQTCWVHGSSVIIGCRKGQVLLFGFSEAALNKGLSGKQK